MDNLGKMHMIGQDVIGRQSGKAIYWCSNTYLYEVARQSTNHCSGHGSFGHDGIGAYSIAMPQNCLFAIWHGVVGV